MKKLAILLAALLLLTACASQTEPVKTTETPVSEATAAPTEAPTEAVTTEPVSESLDCATAFVIAKTYINKSLDELLPHAGEPSEVYYEESCIGDGYDGILVFSYYTVYTYREADGSAETVVDVEMND